MTRLAAVSAEQAHLPVVVNVVYDGPPEAGKTTSVRALARGFGREVYTPEEQSGRTVYFDWLVHTGGRFEGAPICCQIASVPGQTRWAARRKHFLESADVIVFVGDTSAEAWPLTLERLAKLREYLDGREGAPVGIVFQANRRDVSSAVPIQEVHAKIGSARIAVVESVAVEGTGVREAFVFAVRLALDRLKSLRSLEGQREQKLRDPLDELAFLKEGESAPAEVPRAPTATGATGAHRPPSEDVPSGLIWPPVEGRIVLRAAVGGGVPMPVNDAGDCLVGANETFILHSERDAVFVDLDVARRRLVEWARLHSGALPVLSPARCLVVAAGEDGEWRLWQVVRREPSLRRAFADGLDLTDPTRTAKRLAQFGRLLTEARYLCAATELPLPCSLDTIGASELAEPRYIAPLPLNVPAYSDEPASAELVARELASLLAGWSPSECSEVGSAVKRTPPRAFGPANGLRIRRLLVEMLT